MLERIDEAIQKLRSLKKILLVSHYDADGLSSAAIMKSALEREGIAFKVLIAKEIDEKIVEKIKNENLPVVFTDIGSSPLVETLNQEIVIIDHHEPLQSKKVNIVEVNPEMNSISEYSGSCVTYLVAKRLNKKNENLADIALVGLAGDSTIGPEGIKGRCEEIVGDALKYGLVKIEKGIRIFGYFSRPLHKALEYSFNPYIPKISGSESAVVQFLSELGISVKEQDKFRRFVDLSEEEKLKLASAIILERIAHGVENPTEIFGTNYFLTRCNYELNEFATIVNAFGRLEKFEEGIEFCMNPNEERGEEILKEYRSVLGRYLRWAKDNLEKRSELIFIVAKNNIHANFIAPVISVFSSLMKEKVVVGCAYDGDFVKFSVRNKTDIKVHKIVSEIAVQLGGVGGGHKQACGAKIPKENEERFLSLLEQSLKNVINKKV